MFIESKLLPDDKPDKIPTLALRPREAAKALGISERTLWTLTKAGRIACVRVGRAVLYSIETLRVFLASENGGKP
jgi:excisionase family DNA binding protein